MHKAAVKCLTQDETTRIRRILWIDFNDFTVQDRIINFLKGKVVILRLIISVITDPDLAGEDGLGYVANINNLHLFVNILRARHSLTANG